jgi:hypothetical protein
MKPEQEKAEADVQLSQQWYICVLRELMTPSGRSWLKDGISWILVGITWVSLLALGIFFVPSAIATWEAAQTANTQQGIEFLRIQKEQNEMMQTMVQSITQSTAMLGELRRANDQIDVRLKNLEDSVKRIESAQQNMRPPRTSMIEPSLPAAIPIPHAIIPRRDDYVKSQAEASQAVQEIR